MSWFSTDDRDRLRSVADLLIPEAEGMPAASTVGAADALIDRVIHLRSDLAPMVLRAVRTLPSNPTKLAMDNLRTTDAEAYSALTLAIAAAYYISPVVCARTGYHGPQRIAADSGGEFPDADLLTPVISRAPMWRHAPDL